jgi:membrane fusion protein, multidrug efflux system
MTMPETTTGREPAGTASNGRGGGFLRNPRTRRFLLIGGAILVLGVAVAWWYYSGRESTDDAQVDGHIIAVSSRVGGTVLSVKVDDNQYVKAGTLLVEVDPRDYRVALQRAEADYADAQAGLLAARAGVPITSTTTQSQVSSAGANVERAQAGAEAANRDVEAARARLASAQARLKEARANQTRTGRDLERMKELVAKDEVSQQQYDAAVAAAEAANAAVESTTAAINEATQAVSVAESRRIQATGAMTQAQAELRTARTGPEQVAVIKARELSAEARVRQAKAALDMANLNLQYATITAPVSGVVSRRSVEPGQTIQPGQPLLAVVPLEDGARTPGRPSIWVTANFKETQLKAMRVGQRAEVDVDAYGRSYSGKVDSIAAATGARFSLLPPENATGNYVKVVQRVPVKIVLDNGQDPEHLLRPGMSVVATVYTR